MKSISYIALSALLISACSGTEDQSATDAVPTPEAEAPVLADNTLPLEVEMAAPDVDAQDIAIRSVEAHDHGSATLSIVIEDQRVIAELETPLYNLVGFEHAPRTDAQTEAVAAAEAALADPGAWLSFNAEASCTAQDLDADVALFSDTEHGHDNDHDDDYHHDEDDHDDDHASDHGDGDGHAAEHETHRDTIVTYSYVCDVPAALERVSADMFDVFPNMAEVDGVYLGPDTQASFVLSSSQTEAKLRP